MDYSTASASVANPQMEDDDEGIFTEFKGEMPRMRVIEPLTLEYRDINLKVPFKDRASNKRGMKNVLQSINGRARHGSFTAIMGPSGGGKTTLLNVLAGRVMSVKGGQLTGHLIVNGAPRNESAFKSQAAFVQQDDILYAFLTVRETLMMATHFHLGFTLSREEKEKYVSSIIGVLGLTKAQHTIIGDAKVRGVSGGERKRVNIGVELIQDPAILFLDEPSTGLDSFQALSVMSAIKTLCKNERTVIASIHQPRSSIVRLFDQLHLLSEGRTIYYGPASHALKHLASQGHHCPPSFNPADWFIDLVSIDRRSHEQETTSRDRVEQLQRVWRTEETLRSPNAASPPPTEGGEEGVTCVTPRTRAVFKALEKTDSSKYRIGWSTQFYLLLWRQFSLIFRNRTAIAIRIGMAVWFSLILGAIYSNHTDNQKSIQDRVGLLFGCMLNQTFGSMIGILNTFTEEKHIVQRERASKAYRLSAYFIAKVLSELPINLLACSLFSTVVFWIGNLNHVWDRYLIFMGVLNTVATCAAALGIMVAAMAPNADAANGMAPMFNISLMLLSGFLINIKSLPVGAQWTPYCSFLKWGFQSLVINEFRGREFECTATGPCVTSGEQVIKAMSFDDQSIGNSVGYIFVIMAVIITLAYILLRVASPRYMKVGEPSKGQDGAGNTPTTNVSGNTPTTNVSQKGLVKA